MLIDIPKLLGSVGTGYAKSCLDSTVSNENTIKLISKVTKKIHLLLYFITPPK